MSTVRTQWFYEHKLSPTETTEADFQEFLQVQTSIMKLKGDSKEDTNVFVAGLAGILRKRWDKNSVDATNCYAANNTLTNQYCIALARKIAAFRKNPNQPSVDESSYPYELLMPTVDEKNYLEGRKFNQLAPHEFVLTDDRSGFISLAASMPDIKSEPYLRAHAETFMTYDKTNPGGVRALSEAEIKRCQTAIAGGQPQNAPAPATTSAVVLDDKKSETKSSPQTVSPSVPLPLLQDEKERVDVATDLKSRHSRVLFNEFADRDDWLADDEKLSTLLASRPDKEADLAEARVYLIKTIKDLKLESHSKYSYWDYYVRNLDKWINMSSSTFDQRTIEIVRKELSGDLDLLTALIYRTAITMRKPQNHDNVARLSKVVDDIGMVSRKNKHDVIMARERMATCLILFGVACIAMAAFALLFLAPPLLLTMSVPISLSPIPLFVGCMAMQSSTSTKSDTIALDTSTVGLFPTRKQSTAPNEQKKAESATITATATPALTT